MFRDPEQMAKLNIRLLENKKRKPFNSEDMRQQPFEFFWDDHNFHPPDKEELERQEFAKRFFDKPCGYLHLGWDVDAYWTMVVNKVMAPYVHAIYDELVRLGHDEADPHMYGDADGDFFWIPAKNPETKVLVHYNQTHDYLYVLTTLEPKWGPKQPRHNFHIRRIWRDPKSEKNHWHLEDIEKLYCHVLGKDPEHIEMLEQSSSEDLIKDILSDVVFDSDKLKTMSREELINIILRGQTSGGMSKSKFIEKIIERATWHEALSDEHYQFSQRPSLEYYRQRDFNMDLHRDYKVPFNGIFGDARDPGYVISVKSDESTIGRAEHTQHSSSTLETIATCSLPSMAAQLELQINSEWFKNNR